MRTDAELREAMLTTWRKAGPIYGDNVMPTIEMYKYLSAPEEKKAFQDALEGMLGDPDPNVRSIATAICLGFFVFRNVV